VALNFNPQAFADCELVYVPPHAVIVAGKFAPPNANGDDWNVTDCSNGCVVE
jgi:hypothetical protein